MASNQLVYGSVAHTQAHTHSHADMHTHTRSFINTSRRGNERPVGENTKRFYEENCIGSMPLCILMGWAGQNSRFDFALRWNWSEWHPASDICYDGIWWWRQWPDLDLNRLSRLSQLSHILRLIYLSVIWGWLCTQPMYVCDHFGWASSSLAGNTFGLWTKQSSQHCDTMTQSVNDLLAVLRLVVQRLNLFLSFLCFYFSFVHAAVDSVLHFNSMGNSQLWFQYNAQSEMVNDVRLVGTITVRNQFTQLLETFHPMPVNRCRWRKWIFMV